ncbi:hypothetical protein MUG94_01500 [Arthrobacter gengyunqii]|uniref:Uncharacterized protein n=1 Tax=Arthrobacter gengyunqii TaxID=2886940 RepID=A0A9X1S7V7_9MICC|nr:hypothetical protein [Arthrobacter gengyunqii]MCC3270806.1 hypothetical protein [Arthrobacter gengyunqii]UOY96498.1 hypothetical protein MUG94_01500 [Arthrobacter gengyunqii]
MTDKGDDDALPPALIPADVLAGETASADTLPADTPPTDTPPRHPYAAPGPLAVALGYVVGCLVLAVIATTVVGWGTSRDFWGYVWTVIVAAFYAAGLGLFTALPVALILGWSLRGVLSQGLHVLAFFVVPALLGWVIIGLSVQAVVVPLLMGAAIGVSMAAGRAAVWPFARA